MSDDEGLTRLRAIRRGNRAVVTKSINEVQGLLTMEQWSEESITRLNVLKQHLDSKRNTLNELDAKILNEIKVEDVEKEIEEAEDVVIKITEAREKIERAMRTINTTSQLTTVEDNNINEQAASAGTANVPSATTRLPKLQLPHFKGDVTKWSSFWDCFNSAVDTNGAISKIDKYNYLRGCVCKILPLTLDQNINLP